MLTGTRGARFASIESAPQSALADGHAVVPSLGSPASFVNEQLRSGEPEIARGRIRMSAPAAQVKARIPERWAIVEALGDSA